jgi:hypothetical protein
VLVVLAMAATSPGRAPLRLEFEHCADIDQAIVNRVVAMELEADLAEARQGAEVTTAKAECSDGRVSLTVDDPVTGKVSTRIVSLDGQGRGVSSRLLGLAISEAVLASWIELHLTRQPDRAPSMTLASLESRREAADIAERRLVTARPTPSPRSEIAVGPAGRWFSSGLLLFGVSANSRRWSNDYPSAGVGLDVDVGYGTHSVATLARGSALAGSIAPSLLMRSTFAGISVTADAGLRVGLARLSSEPVSPRRWGRPGLRGWLGPFLAVDFAFPLGRRSFLRAAAETGYAAVPARGGIDSVEVIALGGSWLTTVLSFGATL